MGQHTWFEKDRDLFKRQLELNKKLDAFENNEIVLSESDIDSIKLELDEIEEKNSTNYHNCFRTNKRNPDGSYLDDVIYSKQECDVWLDENNLSVYYLNEELVNKFWEEYPNGVIYFL